MNRANPSLVPRKTPVQARSAHTVEAICQACIHILLDGGMERLTTTRVAHRAGASVGSVYQYFPNKQSLLAAVLTRHLTQVVEAVEAACIAAKYRPVAHMAEVVVDSFLNAKLRDAAASQALYAVAAEVGGTAVVLQMMQRTQLALCDMLATASDRKYEDLAIVSFVISTSVVGPAQALLSTDPKASQIVAIKGQLVTMVSAYLRAVGAVIKSK